jgi:hypothetical protein
MSTMVDNDQPPVPTSCCAVLYTTSLADCRREGVAPCAEKSSTAEMGSHSAYCAIAGPVVNLTVWSWPTVAVTTVISLHTLLSSAWTVL